MLSVVKAGRGGVENATRTILRLHAVSDFKFAETYTEGYGTKGTRVE
jgi:hypothetical protein